jgi:hypothetical protein
MLHVVMVYGKVFRKRLQLDATLLTESIKEIKEPLRRLKAGVTFYRWSLYTHKEIRFDALLPIS